MAISGIPYPNLESMETHFRQAIAANPVFKEKYVHPEIDVEVFMQEWGSTNTAFDVDKDGGNVFGGSAITKAFTVVFKEKMTGSYGVFIDNKACYMVTDATEEFLEDLKNHCLAGLREAAKRY